ncbi:hemophilus-specific protein [Mannheimia haemolytica]|uniref:hemophilus-specific protein n=1 Tax=Mannheimia haemolytica TaxID=75985 RepID=UPI00201BF25B|nr:hemophilus-specific protein [Mannheimia haemolytica]UQX80499.1 hemophilus-specific protein [Mannheimia haemolytica]
MKNEYNLEQLKYIWDNRNLENKVYQYLFHICIEPMKKGDWNRYTIWLNFYGNLINVSDVVYRVVESQKLKDDIKIWYDKQYYCRPTKVETTGFISIFLHLFYEGIARILLEQGMITETEAAEKSYNFRAANCFQRLL